MTVTLVHPERVNRVDVHHQVAVTPGTSTWIGVTSLAAPGYLVEVDAVAVLT